MMSTLSIRVVRVFKREGLIGFFSLFISHSYVWLRKLFLQCIMAPIALPIAGVILFISPWIRIRLIMLPSNRVGEYAASPEIMLHAFESLSDNSKNFFYVIPSQPISNEQLHKMWKRTLTILPFPHILCEVDRYVMMLGGKKMTSDPFRKFFDARRFDYRDRWGFLQRTKKNKLTFVESEEKKGQRILAEMGIPSGAKFVCLLVRDERYLNVSNPAKDWSYLDYRNASIENYAMAATFLAEKGYYVIRLGQHVKDPFIVNHPHVIDYANSSFRSDFMDVYLSAKCFFFISTSTGLDSIARIFRRPVLVTNFPLFDLDPGVFYAFLIPKKIKNKKNNTLLTFKEMYQQLGDASKENTVMKVVLEKELALVENTPEEITEVTQEMLAFLTHSRKYSSEEDHWQEQFWDDFLKHAFWKKGLSKESPPVLNTPVLTGKPIEMRIGNDFFKNNLNLLA